MQNHPANSGISIVPRAVHGGKIRLLAQRAGCREDEIIDFSASINPLGPPEGIRSVIARAVADIEKYPDCESLKLRTCLARAHGTEPECILPGNGSTELIFSIPRAFQLDRAVIPGPSYSDYSVACLQAGMKVDRVYPDPDNGFEITFDLLTESLTGRELVFIGQPNNPTGRYTDREIITRAARRFPESIFVVDESFGDFVESYDTLISSSLPNILVVKSLTKFYAIPGVRLGFVQGPQQMIRRITDLLPSWTVNTFAHAVGCAVLEDTEYALRTRNTNTVERKCLTAKLREIPQLTVFESEANFFLFRIEKQGVDGNRLADMALKQRVAIRVCDSFDGLDSRYVRIAVRGREENELLVEVIRAAITGDYIPKQSKKRKPALMFQGASSNAGKSVLTAALCRILVQDGVRVAPFKAQNMSLNSFVTADGGEMGRAQVVQAQACRIAPDVRMNPVLLKPNSDTGSQVIVMGKVIDSMRVREYVTYKPQAFEAVKESYNSLSEEYDAIVLEGAGSPGEINLKRHDIVNMTMARYARSPVLLVGDIDRGGVFAAFIGTMETLNPWERELVAGFVVNRFRGDPTLLEPAFVYTENHTGKPTVGVVPYLHNLGIPEEDSVTFKCGGMQKDTSGSGEIIIGLVDLPHISNFTDFDAFELEPDVTVRVIRRPEDIDGVDAAVIPGSKNVAGDLGSLRQSGMTQRLHRAAENDGIDIVGICGGYQMLGTLITDPHGLESGGEGITGMGLLPVETVMGRDKVLARTSGIHTESGFPVSGYEIHHGRSSYEECTILFRKSDGEPIGVGTPDHRIWGSYLHGVFDKDEFRRWFINRLRMKRSLEPLPGVVARYDIEAALDRLADTVRENIDMKAIYTMMGL